MSPPRRPPQHWSSNQSPLPTRRRQDPVSAADPTPAAATAAPAPSLRLHRLSLPLDRLLSERSPTVPVERPPSGCGCRRRSSGRSAPVGKSPTGRSDSAANRRRRARSLTAFGSCCRRARAARVISSARPDADGRPPEPAPDRRIRRMPPMERRPPRSGPIAPSGKAVPPPPGPPVVAQRQGHSSAARVGTSAAWFKSRVPVVARWRDPRPWRRRTSRRRPGGGPGGGPRSWSGQPAERSAQAPASYRPASPSARPGRPAAAGHGSTRRPTSPFPRAKLSSSAASRRRSSVPS